MFEKKNEKLAPWPRFVRRLGFSAALGFGVVFAALLFGVVGYHSLAGLRWIDALLNASMILTGMGPVDPMTTTSAKLFASAYALFSGVVFLSAVGIILSPIFHRLLHAFHIEEKG
jgi:hypothetical protein